MIAPRTAQVKVAGRLHEWQAMARRVLAGEFKGADAAFLEAVERGLGGWGDATCERALAEVRRLRGRGEARQARAAAREEGALI